MTNQRKKADSAKSERHYTFVVSVSFDMQFTFSENEVGPSEEGGKGDIDPTEEALANLEHELEEYLALEYPINKVEAWTDFESLLGIVEEPATKRPSRKFVHRTDR